MYMSQSYLAQVDLFAGQTVPRGWMACKGQLLPIETYSQLFSLLGTTYGGNGRTDFGLPNLTDQNDVPYYINVASQPIGEGATPTAVLSEIILFAGNFTIRGYAECNGQLVSLSGNEALYAALGPGWPTENNAFPLPNLTPPNEHMRYLIALTGMEPAGQGGNYQNLEGTVSGIGTVANTNPVTSPTWVPADGRSLASDEYQMLFSQIGTKYGGDADNFKVPDIQSQNEYFRYAINTKGEYPTNN